MIGAIKLKLCNPESAPIKTIKLYKIIALLNPWDNDKNNPCQQCMPLQILVSFPINYIDLSPSSIY